MDETSKQTLNGSPAIFIDGVLYDNPEQLLKVNPKDCYKIETVRSSIIVNFKIYQGIVSLQTKKSNLKNINLPKNLSKSPSASGM